MKVLFGNDLVKELRIQCDNVSSKLWLAVHFIGCEESFRKIIGKQWLLKKSLSIRLLLDLTHFKNINPEVIEIFNKMGAVKLLKGLHAKVYIIDDKCILTSANLTETAFFKRYEIGVLLEGAEAKDVIDIYQKWWDIGESINSNLGKELINDALMNQDSISDQLPMLWNLPVDLDNFESYAEVS